MAVTFAANAEVESGRMAITANGGVPGDSFYLLRRDRNGSRLVRETSEAGVVWQSDPSSLRTNYATNPVLSVNALNWSNDFGTGGANTVKNLIPNSNCNPGATDIEISRNKFQNPNFVGGSAGVPSGHTTYSYLTTTSGTRDNTSTAGRQKFTATGQAVNARYGNYAIYTTSGNANVPVTYKCKFVRSGAGGSVVIWIDFYDAGGATVTGAAGTHTTSSTAASGELVVNHRPTANWTSIRVYLWIENKTAATIAGTTNAEFYEPIIATGMAGWSSDTVQYYDGDTPADADSEYAWTGTANASESTRTAKNCLGYAMGPPGGISSMTTLSVEGVTHLALFPSNSGITDTFVNPGGQDAGGIRLGMVAGTNYTVRATCTLLAPQVGTLHANARTIYTVVKSTVAGTVTRISSVAPNAAGSTDLSVSMTLPADTTEAYIRLYSGNSLGNGTVLWTNVYLLPSTYSGDYFTGDDFDTEFFNYSWDGTPNNSASTKTGITGRVVLPGGQGVYQAAWAMASTGGTPGILYQETVSGIAGDKWSARMKVAATQDRNMRFTVQFRTGSTLVNEVYVSPTYFATNGLQEYVLDGATASGTYDNVRIFAHAYGHTFFSGEWMRATDVLLEKTPTAGPFFTGSTDDPAYSGWNGTAGQSTSWIAPAAQEITLYDYEARQGLETDYILTDELGNIGATQTVTIPDWGTWLKDPFRPFANVRVLWHGDSEYSRKARRELFYPRGSKYPVPLWDVRVAPDSSVEVATETTDEAIALTTLLDTAGVIMIDVKQEFGVPVRYVSIGDVSGRRAGSDPTRDLGWEARIWKFDINEVEYPLGSPVGQTLSYSMVEGFFDSYLAVATGVASYESLAAGIWEV